MDEATSTSLEDGQSTLEERLLRIYARATPPEASSFLKKLDRVGFVLINEDPAIRPYDHAGLPGGIVQLKRDIPTIIVPDLHARMDFFISTMQLIMPDGRTVLEKLENESVQVVCVGDGFHAEGRAAHRWQLAYEEFKKNYKKHRNMDEEMRESLGVMEMVIEVKSAFPRVFHFLKGNHENISNEQGDGNHPFRKYAFEGPMVAQYVRQFYGDEFLENYYGFEKSLPLFAVGRNFLISHAEPSEFFDRESILEYRDRPDVVEGLTWTANDEAEENSVDLMLEGFLEGDDGEVFYYFGGHRPVAENYHLRASGRYVQIHNPERFIIALINSDGAIELERDIREIENVMQADTREGETGSTDSTSK
jgi:hypothetical protein